ncbi:SHOCT domain-containing protein [Candidatus Pelagibacter sp.]|nr:SHOCT domain-containing protein [Candidatus Pelagibacter sp.]
MKKILGIVVLGLLLPCIAISKTINIENRVKLNVPDNFNYVKVDTYSDLFEGFFDALGKDANFYYIGSNDSIEFANLLVTEGEDLLQPIMEKIETKNFKTEKSMMNFISKEFKKLIRKYNYEGVIWVYLSKENLEDVDTELFEIANEVKNMNKNDLKKESLKFKKILKDELGINGIDGIKMKISKFKIEKNPINEPAFDLKIAANMFNINWDMEIYGYINDKKPLLVGSECIGKCKSISDVKRKIIFSKISPVDSSGIVNNLKSLNELFQSGALTKEEFEKAKKKLLN